MAKAKIAVTLDHELLTKVDRLVREKVFASRSQALQAAVREKIERMEPSRLARECAKLDPAFEQAMADEGLASEISEWPEY